MGTLLKYYDGTKWVSFTGDVPAPTTSIITKEVPTGLVNSSNKAFTVLSGIYVGGSLQVYINGLAQSGLITETTPASGIFNLDTAPLTGDTIAVSYMVAPTGTGNADTVDGIHASSTPTANMLLPLNSSGLSVKPVRLQAISTNSIENVVEQTGWGYIQGNGTNYVTATITFPEAFTSIKNVLITALGSTSSSVPTAITSFNIGFGGNIIMWHIYSITNTTMVVRATLDSSATLANSLYAGFSWSAKGVI